MPPRRLVRAFLALWITLGLVLLVAGVRTLIEVRAGLAQGPPNIHLAALAAVEAVAAALFVFPRTMRLGALGLLATFSIAIAAHALTGQFPLTLVLYAAATSFVLVHGPVPWRAAFGRDDPAQPHSPRA